MLSDVTMGQEIKSRKRSKRYVDVCMPAPSAFCDDGRWPHKISQFGEMLNPLVAAEVLSIFAAFVSLRLVIISRPKVISFAVLILIISLVLPQYMLPFRNFLASFSTAPRTLNNSNMVNFKTPPAPTVPTAIKAKEGLKSGEGGECIIALRQV